MLQLKPLKQRKTSGHRNPYNAVQKYLSCIFYFPLWLARPSDLAVGGQAVIEGVMMRGYKGYAIAVRQFNGNVAVKREEKIPLTKRYKFLGIPFLRGVVILFEALIIGIRAL